jgi:prephenate dehydratase
MSFQTGNTSANKAGSNQAYAFLGPVGTFTELALAQVPEAVGAHWNAMHSVPEALAAVINGSVQRAVVPVESSVEGGVSATLDALATIGDLRIYGEYLVPVNFNLVVRPGTKLSDVKTVAAHPVAYAQVQAWLHANLPNAVHLPASSNAAAAADLLTSSAADAAVSTTHITDHYAVEVLATKIADNPHAQTRFIQVGLPDIQPAPTGADKTSVIVELPSDRPGTLLEMLEQFAARGVNLTRIESRPIGDRLGRYRFNVDAEGHIQDQNLGEALSGLYRFSPKVTFLGSYPRADKLESKPTGNNTNAEFAESNQWLAALREGH